MISVGPHAVTPVVDSVVRRPASLLYPQTNPDVWAAHADLLGPDATIELCMGGYVLRTGDRVVLIDAGVGPDGWRAPSGASIPGGTLLDNLRTAGVAPEAVTDVLLTHLHPDHIGWATLGDAPVFPHATYRCHRADWTFFVDDDNEDDTARRLLAPIAARFEMFDGSGPLFAGVDVVEAPGHTPGSTIVVLSAPAGERAVLLGDVVHCPLELVDDALETIGDVDPQLARATREHIVRELDEGVTAVGAAHFPELRFGRLMRSGSRRTWVSLS